MVRVGWLAWALCLDCVLGGVTGWIGNGRVVVGTQQTAFDTTLDD